MIVWDLPGPLFLLQCYGIFYLCLSNLLIIFLPKIVPVARDLLEQRAQGKRDLIILKTVAGAATASVTPAGQPGNRYVVGSPNPNNTAAAAPTQPASVSAVVAHTHSSDRMLEFILILAPRLSMPALVRHTQSLSISSDQPAQPCILTQDEINAEIALSRDSAQRLAHQLTEVYNYLIFLGDVPYVSLASSTFAHIVIQLESGCWRNCLLSCP